MAKWITDFKVKGFSVSGNVQPPLCVKIITQLTCNFVQTSVISSNFESQYVCLLQKNYTHCNYFLSSEDLVVLV